MTRSKAPQILICDDDPLFHMTVKQALRGQFECRSAHNGDEALLILSKQSIDLVLMDVHMRTPDEGLRYIGRLREANPEAFIIMSSGSTDFQTVREAMKLGAMDYVPKDFDPEELLLTLSSALEKKSLIQRKDQQSFEAHSSQKKHVLIGESEAMRSLRAMTDRIRISNANVLITGETGTGKEVVARRLRKTLPDGTLEPFVAIDSATIQSTTAESYLFGHERGGFPGAERTTKRGFEEEKRGMVYFDEIGNMPLEIQAKLLRVLQEKEISRLGSSRSIQLDFRVISATNKDLDAMVSQGQFKEDLLQRINVIPIHLAPLRDRKEDIPALLDHFAEINRAKLTFTEEAVRSMQAYRWPGNIRELANMVAYLLAMSVSPEIELADLPPKIRDAARAAAAPGLIEAGQSEQLTFYQQVAEFEKRVLNEEYQRAECNVSRLALRLGMDRSHLYSKLKEHGLRGQATP